ncbi:ppsD, partial [Symbiodinium sp. CCMP2456]
FCIIDPEVEEEYLDTVLADISAVDEQGRFVSLPSGIVEGLLGKEGSCRVADVGVTTEHAMVSVFTESFVPRASVVMDTDRKLYLANLPQDIAEEELREVFGVYGRIEEVIVLGSKAADRTDRTGFVKFVDKEDAAAALAVLNDMYQFREDSETVRVSWARPHRDDKGHKGHGHGYGYAGGQSGGKGPPMPPLPAPPSGGPPPPPPAAPPPPPMPAPKGGGGFRGPGQGEKLWVGNLPGDITETEMHKAFGQFGSVDEVNILPARSRSGQLCAFVRYATPAEVTAGARVAGATVLPVVVAAAAAAAVGVQGAEDAVDSPVAAAAAAAKATMLLVVAALVAAALVAAVEQMASGSRAAEASQWNRSWLVGDRSASNWRGLQQVAESHEQPQAMFKRSIARWQQRNGTLELKPWDEDAESMQVSMRPGRLVIARADALHHRFSSVGCAYCLTCFFNNIVAAEQEPVSPCGFALQQWAKERMTRYKQSTVQEQRYMEMPRDWEEKINREMVNTQRIALRTACTKQPGTEDPLGFALAMNSGPDYALSVPMMRWEHEMVYEDDIMAWQHGKTCCMHGAFIEGIELFDCTAFRISRAEASGMDPGHRLTLETGYEALVKDGYRANTLMNSRGGVYVANPPPVEWAMTPKDIAAGGVCGGGGSIACGRFSFVHGLKGPCISVDVEGASSLVVVNYACANLSWTGGWEPIPFALCNSWNLQLNPAPYVHLSSCGLLSPKGRTFAFDASACGYIRGDCVTSIVLKAGNVEGEAENELGYLAGSATNQSGRRSHLAAPDCLALQEVIHEALRQTQITGLDVDAVESCADGKILDDSLEATAFARAYRPQGTLNVDDTAPLGIISAKSGVGNQLEAAGISQILKVILGSRAAAFHPTPHLRIVNPHIDIEMCERNAIIAGESLDFRLPSTYTGSSLSR